MAYSIDSFLLASKVLSLLKMSGEMLDGGTCREQLIERRKRRRFAAKWPVRFLGTTQETIDARTLDVSICGFFCDSPRPFSVGERLTAFLDIPDVTGDRDAALVLQCEIHILRIEPLMNSNWGAACEIMEYSILRQPRAGLDLGTNFEIR